MTDTSNEEPLAGPHGVVSDSHGQVEAYTTASEAVGGFDDTARLEDELEEAKSRADEAHNKYLRALADFENYRKRSDRERDDIRRNTKKDLLRKILTVRDNLERALQYGAASEGGEGLLEGVRLTQYQVDQILEQEGATAIEAAGQPFDPAIEEAIQSVHDPSVPDHTVIQVVRAGYMLGDEVLRPAQVIVSVHQG